MSREGAPPPIFNEDGSLNADTLNEQFGLGTEDAMQEVTFGSYTGTVAEMLADARCPVGGMINRAFTTSGIEGVTQQFSNLKMMDPNFEVTISEATIERHVKKK